jgi:hypothetical protein
MAEPDTQAAGSPSVKALHNYPANGNIAADLR